jgi:hypothetical protein
MGRDDEYLVHRAHKPTPGRRRPIGGPEGAHNARPLITRSPEPPARYPGIMHSRVIREHEPEAFRSPSTCTLRDYARARFESFHVDPLAAEELLRRAILWHTRGATDDGIV